MAGLLRNGIRMNTVDVVTEVLVSSSERVNIVMVFSTANDEASSRGISTVARKLPLGVPETSGDESSSSNNSSTIANTPGMEQEFGRSNKTNTHIVKTCNGKIAASTAAGDGDGAGHSTVVREGGSFSGVGTSDGNEDACVGGGRKKREGIGNTLHFFVDGRLVEHVITNIPQSVSFFFGISGSLVLNIASFGKLKENPGYESNCTPHKWK